MPSSTSLALEKKVNEAFNIQNAVVYKYLLITKNCLKLSE